ncbi:transcription factor 7-like 1-D isoform X2 [Nelusetta ayraudi]|uniref:transcription factor 7-like 1-D isoform X2 n=1 Tax=Nelusetta ayraudi TaxID=303726 RepID=UPI003F7236A7
MSPKKKSDIGTHMLEGMEWRQVSSTLEAAFSEMLDDPDASTPKPPPPTPVTVVPESGGGGGGCHQSVNQLSGGCCAFVPLRAPAPHYFNEAVAPNVFMGHSAPMVDQGLMYSQHPMWSCVMYNQEVGYNPPLYNNVPVVMLPASPDPSLHPVGYMNGQVFYKIPTGAFVPPDYPARQTCVFYPNLAQHLSQQEETQPYVKKPLNAFMIFRKEQRPIVMAEQKIRDSATVNAIVGQKWKRLTKEEQDRYYKEAEKEKRLHALRHPDWSPKYNYGKSKVKNRKNTRKAHKEPTTNVRSSTPQDKVI